MWRQLAWGAAVGGLCAAGAGCVNYQHNALAISLSACHEREMEYPASVRQRVYLFLVNGFDPTDGAGLCSLRDQVVAAGYPKVYTAQQIDMAWYERECRRVARDDPAARLILFAAGASATRAAGLASGLVADGVAVDALVLLDPTPGEKPPCARPCRVVTLRSRGHFAAPPWPDAEEYRVERPALHKAAGSPDVVGAVVKLMTESCGRAGPLDADPPPSVPLSDRPRPTPRGEPGAALGPPDEWDFLKTPPKGGVPASPPELRVAPPHPVLGPVPAPAGEALPKPRAAGER